MSHIKRIEVEKETLLKIIQNKGLAALGDTYVNFIYSLAKSQVTGKPQGEKVPGKILVEALKSSGLRDSLLPRRLSSHAVSNAAESLLVYVWLHKYISLDEAVSILSSQLHIENLTSRAREWKQGVHAFTLLLVKIKEMFMVIP